MAQTRPTNWITLFAGEHRTEYKFVIGGTTYKGSSIKGTPVITKPLLDVPAIGRCCTGSAKLTVYPKSTIPKAATVDAYCRLSSTDGSTVTDWMPQGKFYISTRGKQSPLEINCLDRMVKAGTTYLDKTAYVEWPQPMSAIVAEICQIMGVPLDARTVIKTGTGYTVDRPNEDTLISEILSMIAAAHGGNWIITESGKLRLVVLASPSGSVAQYLNRAHTDFTSRGEVQMVTRVTLTDVAGNQVTAGDDTGLALAAKCWSATQAMANALCDASGRSIKDGVITIPGATVTKGKLDLPTAATLSKGKLDLSTDSTLYGVRYEPYALDGAYLDPALELGDTVAVTARDGSDHVVVLQSIKMNCTVACTCAASALINGETEDEYPFLTVQELSLTRTVRTDQIYYGNRINRSEGFVSELVVEDEVTARMIANASAFSMQSKEGGSWVDRIYFDNITGKYVITGDVTVQGLATFINSLATAGSTVINGGNIITGQIKSNAGDGFTIDLNAGTISVGGENLHAALSALSDQIALVVTETQSGTIVNAASIVAAINDSGSSVVIDADKIDLNGYVTVTDLSTAGSTSINGANIITGTVTATQIDATHLRVSASNITGTLTIGQLPNTVAETSDIPTKVSELTNDSGYQTQNGVTTIIGNTVTTGYVNALGITAESLHSDDGTSFHRQVYIEGGMIDFKYGGPILAQMGINGITGLLMIDATYGIQLGDGSGNTELYGSSLPSSNLYPGRLFFKI